MSMHNEITVSKWGDSLAVRIPQAIAIQAHISEGDSLAMELSLFDEMGRDGQQYPADEFGRIDLFSRFLAELLADVLSAQSVFLTPYLQPSYARGT